MVTIMGVSTQGMAMAATFSAEEILDVTSGRLAAGLMPDGRGRICTDTRQLAPGDWYLALAGERFDGHDFLGAAFSKGAAGCIVEERPAYAIAASSFPLLAVGSTIEAYQQLARQWRRTVKPLVIGITGSSGKTTTKEMCASVMSAGRRTHKSAANENNEIGVPKTVLAMPADTEVLVVEMAMRARGEIAVLAQTAEPDIGIIVNVGVAHLGPLASLANIIAAKCELFEQLDPELGVAIVGRPDNELMERVRKVFTGKTITCNAGSIRELRVTDKYTEFELLSGDACTPLKLTVHAHGLSHLQDAWCAAIAGREAGLDDELIARGLAAYAPVTGRGNRLPGINGAVVVDESYNANPDSVKASISTFADSRVFTQSKKFVVLGDLAELGDATKDLHRELGQWLKDKSVTGLVAVGTLARYVAEGAQGAGFEIIACLDQSEAEDFLRPRLDADTCVLIKGSHSANLDKLVSRLVPAEEAARKGGS